MIAAYQKSIRLSSHALFWQVVLIIVQILSEAKTVRELCGDAVLSLAVLV